MPSVDRLLDQRARRGPSPARASRGRVGRTSCTARACRGSRRRRCTRLVRRPDRGRRDARAEQEQVGREAAEEPFALLGEEPGLLTGGLTVELEERGKVGLPADVVRAADASTPRCRPAGGACGAVRGGRVRTAPRGSRRRSAADRSPGRRRPALSCTSRPDVLGDLVDDVRANGCRRAPSGTGRGRTRRRDSAQSRKKRERLRFTSRHGRRDLLVGDVLGAEEREQAFLFTARARREDGDRLVAVPDQREQQIAVSRATPTTRAATPDDRRHRLGCPRRGCAPTASTTSGENESYRPSAKRHAQTVTGTKRKDPPGRRVLSGVRGGVLGRPSRWMLVDFAADVFDAGFAVSPCGRNASRRGHGARSPACARCPGTPAASPGAPAAACAPARGTREPGSPKSFASLRIRFDDGSRRGPEAPWPACGTSARSHEPAR